MTTFFVTFTKKEYEIGMNGVLHHIWTKKWSLTSLFLLHGSIEAFLDLRSSEVFKHARNRTLTLRDPCEDLIQNIEG